MADEHSVNTTLTPRRNYLAKQRERRQSQSLGGGRPFSSVEWQFPHVGEMSGETDSHARYMRLRGRSVRRRETFRTDDRAHVNVEALGTRG